MSPGKISDILCTRPCSFSGCRKSVRKTARRSVDPVGRTPRPRLIFASCIFATIYPLYTARNEPRPSDTGDKHLSLTLHPQTKRFRNANPPPPYPPSHPSLAECTFAYIARPCVTLIRYTIYRASEPHVNAEPAWNERIALQRCIHNGSRGGRAYSYKIWRMNVADVLALCIIIYVHA